MQEYSTNKEKNRNSTICFREIDTDQTSRRKAGGYFQGRSYMVINRDFLSFTTVRSNEDRADGLEKVTPS